MTRTYFNEQATIWDDTVTEKDMTKLERMARRLDIQTGSTVLDVGTGTGVFVPYLLEMIGQHGFLVAMDFSEEMLKIAQVKSFNGNIEFLQADVNRIPLRGEIFDAVVCYSSFPHFQDKPVSLNEINRILKRSGKLFICHTSSRAVINDIHGQIPILHNDTIPTESEMQTILTTAGFDSISICENRDSYWASARKCEPYPPVRSA